MLSPTFPFDGTKGLCPRCLGSLVEGLSLPLDEFGTRKCILVSPILECERMVTLDVGSLLVVEKLSTSIDGYCKSMLSDTI